MKMKQPVFRYCWETEIPLSTNIEVLDDFLNNHLSGKYEILLTDKTHAEIKDLTGNKFAIHTLSEGGVCHHKVEFERL